MKKYADFTGVMDSGFEFELFFVPMDDLKEANRQSNSVMGYKEVYGRTADGKVYSFIKGGRWAKRDFKRMRDLGVVEVGCHWTLAPSKFRLPNGEVVGIAGTIEINVKEMDRKWLKALGGVGYGR